jgi:hypothetical protein
LSGVGKRKTLCPKAATQEPRGPVDVDVHPIGVERIVHVVHAAESRGAELRGADVGPVAQRDRGHDVAVLEEREVHGHVGHGPADRPRVGVGHVEQFPRELDDTNLDFVRVKVALVVAFVREPLRVSIAEVGEEEFAGQGADDVLRRDQRQGLREPGVVPVHLIVDEGDVLVHGPSVARNRRADK